MQHNYHNISQTGRRIAGMTQERWAEALDISVESVRLYESGRGMPSDDVATRMVEVSGAPVLGYWHLLNKSRGQCRFRPEDVDKYLASCRVQHVPVAQIIPRAARKAARDLAPEYYPGMRVV